MTSVIRLESILDRVRSLETLVEAHRDEFEELRQMPGEIRNELLDRELYRLWSPIDLGGLELSPPDAVRIIMKLSMLEGAVGWNTMIPAAYSMLAGHMNREAAQEIYGPRDSIVAGSFQPGGNATLSGNYFEATGRWPFGSAGSEATWFLGQCVIEGDERPPPTLPGLPPVRILFAPSDKFSIHDTWFTWGLKGTGSNDYSMDHVQIPRNHCADLFANQPVHEGALYRMPTLPTMIAMVASVPVGIARAAIEVATQLMGTKRLFPTGELYSEREIVRSGIARAENLVGAAEALLLGRLEDVWSAVLNRQAPTSRQRALLRAAASHAGECSTEAVDLVCELAGSDAVYQRSRLERYSRDVHTARAHIAASPKGLVEAGTVLFGGQSPTV